jgi:hypothetical protein
MLKYVKNANPVWGRDLDRQALDVDLELDSPKKRLSEQIRLWVRNTAYRYLKWDSH